jgi:hypothetical protein
MSVIKQYTTGLNVEQLINTLIKCNRTDIVNFYDFEIEQSYKIVFVEQRMWNYTSPVVYLYDKIPTVDLSWTKYNVGDIIDALGFCASNAAVRFFNLESDRLDKIVFVEQRSWDETGENEAILHRRFPKYIPVSDCEPLEAILDSCFPFGRMQRKIK